jgi:hypothetical protein
VIYRSILSPQRCSEREEPSLCRHFEVGGTDGTLPFNELEIVKVTVRPSPGFPPKVPQTIKFANSQVSRALRLALVPRDELKPLIEATLFRRNVVNHRLSGPGGGDAVKFITAPDITRERRFVENARN